MRRTQPQAQPFGVSASLSLTDPHNEAALPEEEEINGEQACDKHSSRLMVGARREGALSPQTPTPSVRACSALSWRAQATEHLLLPTDRRSVRERVP